MSWWPPRPGMPTCFQVALGRPTSRCTTLPHPAPRSSRSSPVPESSPTILDFAQSGYVSIAQTLPYSFPTPVTVSPGGTSGTPVHRRPRGARPERTQHVSGRDVHRDLHALGTVVMNRGRHLRGAVDRQRILGGLVSSLRAKSGQGGAHLGDPSTSGPEMAASVASALRSSCSSAHSFSLRVLQPLPTPWPREAGPGRHKP